MKPFQIVGVNICMVLFILSWAGKPIEALGDSTGNYSIVGIDISRYQGKIDFQKVKAAGISFIFIRATDGITYQDANYETNVSLARATDITVGAYHFYETNDDPIAQLGNFTQTVILKPGDLPPVVDIERLHNQDNVDLSENIKTFLKGLEIHYGVRPIIYTGLRFSNKYLTGFGNYPLWLAEYGRHEPTLPTGWDKWTFWQWSQSYHILGIEKTVDANRFFGDKSSFTKLLVK